MNPLFPPLAIPLLTAVIAVILHRRPRWQQGVGLAGATLLAISGGWLLFRVSGGGVLTLQVGGWPAPYGITLAADILSALLVALTGVVGLAVSAHALIGLGEEQKGFAWHPLLHVLLLGVCGAFLAGDLFNLYVWFEITLIASFALLAAAGRPAQLQGTLRYLVVNLLASALLLTGIGLLYGVTGTLNFADLARTARLHPGIPLLLPAGLFLAAFGIKAALFPFFPWLPASYPAAAPALAAVFAALLTKVGVYALLRLFTLLYLPDGTWQAILLAFAALTMLAGAFGAIAQETLRHLFAYQVIAHIGILLLGLGFFTATGLAGTVFFLVHVVLVNAALFLVAGIIEHRSGSTVLQDLGGLFRRAPGITLLFILPALSQAEIPPFPGFWGKLLLLQAGLAGEFYALAALMLIVNLLTLYALLRVWNEAFWKKPPQEMTAAPPRIYASRSARLLYFAPAALLAFLLLALGLMAHPLALLAQRAAEQLLDPAAYIAAVLGDVP